MGRTLAADRLGVLRRVTSLQHDPIGADRHDAVVCSIRFPDYVAHRRHRWCQLEAPHHIDRCGMFLPIRKTPHTPQQPR
jgi:hypothetical protein